MKFQWPKLAQKWKEGVHRYQYVLLVMAAGLLLLLLPTSGRESRAAARDQAQDQSGGELIQLEQLEEKLSDSLSEIRGAGKVRVVLTLNSSSRQVLAQNVERRGEEGSSVSTVTVGRGSGSQEVVALQTLSPQFRGALVVCSGGADPQVRLQITQAVAALTGLGADRISICTGNT